MNRSRTYTTHRKRKPMTPDARQDEMQELVAIWSTLQIKGELAFHQTKDTVAATINIRGRPAELSDLLAPLMPEEAQEKA